MKALNKQNCPLASFRTVGTCSHTLLKFVCVENTDHSFGNYPIIHVQTNNLPTTIFIKEKRQEHLTYVLLQQINNTETVCLQFLTSGIIQ